MDWVLIIFGTQVIKKKRPVRPVFPDYLSVSYDYGETVSPEVLLRYRSFISVKIPRFLLGASKADSAILS